jgi:hypothetical protein
MPESPSVQAPSTRFRFPNTDEMRALEAQARRTRALKLGLLFVQAAGRVRQVLAALISRDGEIEQRVASPTRH